MIRRATGGADALLLPEPPRAILPPTRQEAPPRGGPRVIPIPKLPPIPTFNVRPSVRR
jgi:hypothetical protein